MSDRAAKQPRRYRYRSPREQPNGQLGTDAQELEHDEIALGERAVSDEPDVFLDVPLLKVDEIHLEVDDLRARVSLSAEVLDLLRLSVGADVGLGRVALDIKGVEAQALLKVRLDNVALILDRVLRTIDQNPQILENLTRGLESTLRDVGTGAGHAVGELGRGTGRAVEDVGRGAGEAVEEVGRGTGGAVHEVGRGTGEVLEDLGGGTSAAVEEVGRGAGKTAESVGGTVKGGGEGDDEPVRDRDRVPKRTAKRAVREGKPVRRHPPEETERERPRPVRRPERPS
ncbi:hypothetical protein [Nonomuraea sp. NEAU-A123]|uniref:hypothetical protein n=1 Tax=Nonomuraea sp. NEAU-A123 TaxID=2839649 RepID=UPI001BE467DE|nr:hypothetical protein [Nonomuraea sp. NEAU-A123]MBT2231131.1 hypothetical protein [Nonomuraea sp. NEAU-A123]